VGFACFSRATRSELHIRDRARALPRVGAGGRANHTALGNRVDFDERDASGVREALYSDGIAAGLERDVDCGISARGVEWESADAGRRGRDNWIAAPVVIRSRCQAR